MQWLKDRVGGNSNNGAPDKQNFMIGSDKWTGSSSMVKHDSSLPSAPMAPKGSFRNPESADNAVQAYDAAVEQPNPYVQYAKAPAGPVGSLSKNSVSSSKKFPEEKMSSGMYPKIFESSEQRALGHANAADAKNGGSDDEEEVLTGQQTLVMIPGAIVHLIDKDESVHLASGDFSLVRLFQDKTKVVVIAKVADQLQWPLVQEEPTVKLDPTHYFFTLTVPADIEDNDSSSKSKRNSSDADAANGTQTLNYGVTFPAGAATSDEHTAMIRELDYFLERYSMFSAPTIVQGEAGKDESKQPEALEKLPPQDPNFPGTVVSAETVSGEGKVVPSEENSKAFWTTIAPNVDDYNHKMSKGIAIGAGHIIRGIFWLSDSTVEKMESGNMFMKSKFKTKEKKTKISPITMGSVRTARRLTQMTDQVAAGVLGGIVYTTGLFSTAVVNSPGGKIFFKLLPGEVALVSLDAFGRVFDAVEKAGKDVMTRSSSVTQDFVNHRYGESAKELTDESLRTVGHTAAIAWTLTKIRKALNPKRGAKVSKTGIAKSLAKSAAGINKKA